MPSFHVSPALLLLAALPSLAAQAPTYTGSSLTPLAPPDQEPVLRATPWAGRQAADFDVGQSELWLPPGEYAVYHLALTEGTVEAEQPVGPELTYDALAAVALAPAWLRPHLSLTLSYLGDSDQDDLAELMLELEDERALDELAFTLAASTPAELSTSLNYGIEQLYVGNALYTYLNDPLVPFAELVDEGEPGVDEDYYTTVTYSYDDGSGLQTWTLPPEHYYWHVVNPKLDMEIPLLMDPEQPPNISSPPAGVHWRHWFMHNDADGAFDYSTHWLEEEPNAEDDDGFEYMGPDGWLHDFAIDPLVVLADDEGRTLLAEIDYGTGTVLATTLDLETAWTAFDIEELVENVAHYVQRRDVLVYDKKAGIDELTLVLSDESGTGAVYAGILDDAGLTVDTWDMTGGLPDLTGYHKLIIPLNLSISSYELLYGKDFASTLESFVSGGGTLLIHADPAMGYSYDFPCGFSATFEEAGTPAFVGHPMLADAIAGFDSVWDLQQYESLSGERALDEALSGLDAIGWWVTQNMFDNVSEYAGTHAYYDGERSVWPERILHNHFGNCGECQDMLTAAFRACLIPSMNVWSIEDHVWNEVYLLDAWHPYQVDWSDGPTRIDYGGVGADAMFDGSKNVSAIMGFHSNGRIADEHIEHYSETITVDVEVTDAEGQPVDGAMVMVAVGNYYYYDEYGLMDVGAWVHTDQQGLATVILGDDRDFWFLVQADFDGETVATPYAIEDIQYPGYPNYFYASDAGAPTISAEEAEAGSSHSLSFQLDASRGAPVASDAEDGASSAAISLAFEIEQTLLDVEPEHNFLGWYASIGYAYGGRMIDPLDEPGTVDVYVADGAGYDAFQAGQPFEALYIAEDVSSLDELIEVETHWRDIYLLISNRGSGAHAHFGSISLSAEADVPTWDTGWADTAEEQGDGKKKEGCGCASRSGRNLGDGLALLALLAGLVARRRE